MLTSERKENVMKFAMSRLTPFMLFVFAILFIAGCGDIGGAKKVTKANYNEIQEGMSYAQVVSIIGSEGEEMASNKMDGVPGVMPSISTKMYSWKNFDGSNMNAMFQNDRLIQKAQFGLN